MSSHKGNYLLCKLLIFCLSASRYEKSAKISADTKPDEQKTIPFYPHREKGQA
jgi:hypothetical protein